MSDDARVSALEFQVRQLQQQVKALTKRVDEIEGRRSTAPSGRSRDKAMPQVIVSRMDGPRRR